MPVSAIRTLFPMDLPDRLKRLLAVGLMLVSCAAHPAGIEGQTFDDRVRLADADLVLNGLGLRAVAWIKGYAAGLYLTRKADTSPEVLATPGPKRIQLKMMLDAKARDFTEAFGSGIRRNSSEADQLALKERVDTLSHTIDLIGVLNKGDVVDLDFIPGRGTLLSINGRPHGKPLPGEDLYAGILRIFIGERPVDRELKTGLLGHKPA